MQSINIGFAGMTHLGIISQVIAATRGFNTIGYHVEDETVKSLSKGDLPIYEPGLKNLFNKNLQKLNYSSKPSALNKCDLVYISVDIPTNNFGTSDLAIINKMIDTVSFHLREDAFIIVLSQVPPGFTRKLSIPHKRVFYQVETLIYGRAVERAMYPERFIVGCADPNAPLPPAIETYLSSFDCPILKMRYESAELSKISINMYLVSSVSTTNILSEICEKLDADWHEIIPALKLDKRIGPHAYLKPGLGIAGGNLERDLATVIRLADNKECNAEVVKSWIADSTYRKDWSLRRFNEVALAGNNIKFIGMLGLAYKENTASIKNSAAIVMLRSLINRTKKYKIKVYDPQVQSETIPFSGFSVVQSPIEVCKNSDVILLMTPWPEFKKLKPTVLANIMKGNLIIDPYSILKTEECSSAGLRHLTLGKAFHI